MKGPMTTQTLRGLNGLDPFHWRGDRTNFTHFNVAFPGLMGSSSLAGADMAAYRDFINTMLTSRIPTKTWTALIRRTSPVARGGRPECLFFTNYTGMGQPLYNATPAIAVRRLRLRPPVIPAQALQESQDFKVPQLRAIYQR